MKILEVTAPEEDEDEVNGDKLVEMIMKDCQPYLRAGVRLHRGMNIRSNESRIFWGMSIAFLFATPPSRSSIDSSHELTHMLNKLYAATGSPVTRNNSIFCAVSPEATSYYGDDFVIFPVGEYDALWNNNIVDAYTRFESSPISSAEFYSIPDATDKLIKKRVEHQLAQENEDEKFSEDDYNKHYEEYYNELYPAGVAKDGWLDYDKIAAKFQNSFNTDLSTAKIEPLVEVLIKCDKYYAINTRFYNHYVREKLLNATQ